ncbi:hypothetical protein WK59_04005 [Burkholderia ubonensis]|uniref:hypothetical protein n=1 Tax=Burkholderia ubonensis TaxID=101571 RepID=UPI00075BAB3D|nr:hypothetical protein [Burkholderia ubonensis]KVD35464.1 hypothetical protein WI84_16490 [Burkholderia ubonensis]KVT91908.1 hypothetical protein WK59_04005 [Burkholderia ubonensis]
MKKSFTATLVDIRRGELVEEATDKLNDLVKAVQDSGKGGKLTLTIDIKPFAKAADAMSVKGNVVVTLPKTTDAEEVFFATYENNLSRNNARQDDLPGISLAQPNAAAG